MDSLVVLAGGFGTRLQSIVSDVPKPLAPVHDFPFLYYLISNWHRQGVNDFIFSLHHKADLVCRFLETLEQVDDLKECTFRTVVEPEPLGTGGGIAEVVEKHSLNGPFLVANADTWLGSGICQLNSSNAPAVALVHVENVARYGSVDIEGDKVRGFTEKGTAGAGWINAGLYRLHGNMFRDFSGQAFSLEKTTFLKLIISGHLNPVKLDSDFIDIGVPDDYHRFCHWIENGRIGRL